MDTRYEASYESQFDVLILHPQKEADVKKFVRANAAGDIVAEVLQCVHVLNFNYGQDVDGNRLSEETISSGNSDCPCTHTLKREELTYEDVQMQEIRKAAKSGWDELKINEVLLWNACKIT